jgi:site-specific DNA-methyltransferase (adenine-specific)
MSEYTLYQGDCLEYMRGMDTGSVDAVITDPPYGIGWKPRVNHRDQVWSDDIEFNPAALLKIGKHHLFWGANYFSDKLPISRSWLTWVKRPLAYDFSNDLRSYATTELAWTDFDCNSRFFNHVWDGGMRAGDQSNRSFNHPAQKPLELMRWCVELISSIGDTIFDPFMGSGTTGVACMQLGRNFIGCEIDPGYFAIAQKRISEAAAQPALFHLDAPKIEAHQAAFV